MYRCESWAIKKAECWRIDAFELWCWRRLLIVAWAERRSNHSILKEINPKYPLKYFWWSSNTLTTWCGEPSLWKRPWWWERLKAKKRAAENKTIRYHHWINGHELWETVEDREAWGTADHGIAKNQTALATEHYHNKFLKALGSWPLVKISWRKFLYWPGNLTWCIFCDCWFHKGMWYSSEFQNVLLS